MIGKVTVSVKRYAAGSYVDGVWTHGSDSSFNVIGSIQPIRNKEVELLPEAARTKAKYWLYTDNAQPEVKVVDLAKPAEGDRITWNSTEYAVLEVGDWSNHISGLPHKVYALVEVGG